VENWIKTETPEDITIKGEEILVWDGCDHHIDYVDVCGDTGNFHMANGSSPTHWQPLSTPIK
jgi:hypothetical protein